MSAHPPVVTILILINYKKNTMTTRKKNLRSSDFDQIQQYMKSEARSIIKDELSSASSTADRKRVDGLEKKMRGLAGEVNKRIAALKEIHGTPAVDRGLKKFLKQYAAAASTERSAGLQFEARALVDPPVTDSVITDGAGNPIGRTQGNMGTNWSLMNRPGMERIDRFDPMMYFQTIFAVATNFKYADVDTSDRANYTPEGQLANQIQLTISERTVDLKKITGVTTATEESLDDINVLEGWLIVVLQREISRKYREQFVVGTGGGGEINGMAYLGDQFDFGVNEADRRADDDLRYPGRYLYVQDVIAAMQTKIQKKNFSPMYAFVSPDLFNKMRIEKNGQDDYVMRLLNNEIYGLRLFITNYMPADALLMLDPDVVTILADQGASLDSPTLAEAGYDASGFSQYVKTIRMALRMNTVVRELERPAIVWVPDWEDVRADLNVELPIASQEFSGKKTEIIKVKDKRSYEQFTAAYKDWLAKETEVYNKIKAVEIENYPKRISALKDLRDPLKVNDRLERHLETITEALKGLGGGVSATGGAFNKDVDALKKEVANMKQRLSAAENNRDAKK